MTSQLVASRARYAPVGAHISEAAASVKTYAKPGGASGALIQATTQNLRLTLDGTAPTSTLGFQLATSAPPLYIPLAGDEVIKVIQETAGGVVQLQWVREI